MLIEVIDRSITYTFNTVQYEYDPLKQELTLQANDSFFKFEHTIVKNTLDGFIRYIGLLVENKPSVNDELALNVSYLENAYNGLCNKFQKSTDNDIENSINKIDNKIGILYEGLNNQLILMERNLKSINEKLKNKIL